MTILEASRMYNLSRQTICNWLKHPDKHLCETRIGREPFDIEEKVEVLRLIETGDLTHRQIAELKHINLYTIRNWIKDKNRILAVYSSQGHLPMITGSSNSSGEETETVSAADDKNAKQHIRDLKNENEFLKAKVAYLEALMEINGTPVAGFKKNPIPGHRQSPRKRHRKCEPPLPRCECIPEELLLSPPPSLFG